MTHVIMSVNIHCASLVLMPSSHRRQNSLVLSCRRCEQNWRQVKTVGDRKFRNCFVQSRNAVRTTENSLESSQFCSHRREDESLVLSLLVVWTWHKETLLCELQDRVSTDRFDYNKLTFCGLHAFLSSHRKLFPLSILNLIFDYINNWFCTITWALLFEE